MSQRAITTTTTSPNPSVKPHCACLIQVVQRGSTFVIDLYTFSSDFAFLYLHLSTAPRENSGLGFWYRPQSRSTTKKAPKQTSAGPSVVGALSGHALDPLAQLVAVAQLTSLQPSLVDWFATAEREQRRYRANLCSPQPTNSC